MFSGTAYDAPPFDNTFTYVGTTTEVSIDVSTSAKAEVGFDGSDVFQGAVDVFTTIDNLLTGLNTDDSAVIRGTLSDFDDAFDQMADYITRIGAEVNIAEDMYEVATKCRNRLVRAIGSRRRCRCCGST